MPPGTKVHLHRAFGCCPLAGAVGSRAHDYLERNGHIIVDDPKDADVQLVNTCGSDAGKAQLTYDAIDRVRAVAKDSAVVAIGCLASIEPNRLDEATRDLRRRALLDPRRLDRLDTIFAPEVVRWEEVPTSLVNRYSDNPLASGWYHVTVGTGCLGRCSFCAIRRATGRPQSRPVIDVLADIDRGIEAGVPDVLCIGSDVSAWGVDLGLTVVDLVRALVAHPGEALFSIEAFEPTLLLAHLDALLPLFASKRFSILAVPIQSGSQRVLDRMRRTYRIDDVMRAMERIRAADPDIVLRTDVIYGYGDETHDELEATLSRLDPFDIVGFNVYQPRPGTPPLELDAAEIAERGARVMEVHRIRERSANTRTPRRMRPLPPKTPDDVAWEPAPRAAGESDGTDAGLVQVRVGRHGGAASDDADDGHARWLASLGTRLGRVLARHGEMTLGGGFRWVAPRVDVSLDALVLEAEGRRGERVAVGLRRPDREGQYAMRSDRFAAWVLPSDVARSEDAQRALRGIFAALGLRSGDAGNARDTPR